MDSLKTLLANASIYTGANILNSAIPFLLMPVLTRVFSPEDYGAMTMFAIVVTILATFTGVNTNSAVGVRYFQLPPRRMPPYVGACLAIWAASSPLVLITIFLCRGWLEAVTHVPGGWLVVAGLAASAQFLIHLRLTLWQVQHKALRYGVFQVSQSLINGGLSLLLVLGLGMAWQGRVLGQALALLSFGCLALFVLLRRSEVSRPETSVDIRDALRFGVPLIPHVLGGFLIATTDRFLISNLLDLSQAGIYMVGLQLGMVLGLLTGAFNRSYAPYLMKALVDEDPARDVKIVRGTYLYFVVVTLGALALGALAPALLGLLVGEEFRVAAAIVPYIALGYAFEGMYYMVANYVFFAGRTGYLALNTLSAGLFNLVATFFLIQRYGIAGAAQAFMLSQAALFLGTWWLARRFRPMPWIGALKAGSSQRQA